MREMIRKRPWLLVVFAMLVFVSVTVGTVIYAEMNPPRLLPEAGGK